MRVSAYIPLAALALGLSGCSGEPRDKSLESELLRTAIVPQVLAWSKSDSKKLYLNDLSALQEFDHICFVWEYQDYKSIEEVLGPIKSYSGTYLGMVPENKVAVVGVIGQSAHASHLASNVFNIVGKKCAALGRASLIKSNRNGTTRIILEDRDANPDNIE